MIKSLKGKGFHFLLSVLLITALTAGGCSSQENEAQEGDGAGGWIFATDHEYSVRPDGYPGLSELYGFEFDDVVIMDLGITYGALKEKQVPLAMGFATDGRIATFELVNLVDDKHFHPVYNAAPNVVKSTLDEYSEITDILNELIPHLDAETMQTLNASVDIDDKEPYDVAKEFLLEKDLIDENPPSASKGTIRVGSKEFTEQILLGQMTILLLENAGFDTTDNTGLVGTSLVREALVNKEIDIYWEYTGTAWMAHLGHEEPLTDPVECYQKVKEEDLQNGIVWLDYTEFDNTYTIMMRRADAENLGIATLSDLADAINSGVSAP
jgi:osmoprotectant transport system permease protein